MTDSVFPVDQGEKVFVDCVDGFTLTSGDRLITCVQDAEYVSPRKLPTCIIGKKIYISLSWQWKDILIFFYSKS